jgi:hypothetical protein
LCPHSPPPALQETFDKKRGEQQQKEQERWGKMAAEYEAEQQRLEALRLAGLGGARNNASSEHFNIISLTYHDTREGHKLQHSVSPGCGAKDSSRS